MATTKLCGDFSAPFHEDPLSISLSYDQAESDPSALKIILETNGFVIVTGIWLPSDVDVQEALLQRDLIEMVDKESLADSSEEAKDLSRVFETFVSGETSWPKASTPGIADKGFFTSAGSPQCFSAWKARCNLKVRTVFSILHSVAPEDLCVGTDVFFYSPTNEAAMSSPFWAHADQRRSLTESDIGGPHSFQGILYASDGSLSTSAQTVVWPGSHKPEIYERLHAHAPPSNSNDHSLYIDRITDRDVMTEFYEGWCTNARRIPVPPGALFIFNSMTIHQGYNGGGSRLAYPISWEPKLYRSEEALKSKLVAILMGIATTHWASLGWHHGASKVKPKRPRYNPDHSKCILPLHPLRPYPVKPAVKIPDPVTLPHMSLAQLKEMVRPEILEMI